ncbi:MAG: hypothetical protein OQJ76_07920 [Rhodospirillales bacterium]|nr:hypothetical protein [Rhodospirillales bacterium]
MPERAIIVHDIAHVRAALAAAAEAGIHVTLISPPGAAAYMGAAMFGEMIDQAAAEYPNAIFTAVLDCSDDPGMALNALRHGVKAIRFAGPEEVKVKIADIAAQSGATIKSSIPGALDLAESDLAERPPGVSSAMPAP